MSGWGKEREKICSWDKLFKISKNIKQNVFFGFCFFLIFFFGILKFIVELNRHVLSWYHSNDSLMLK